MRIQFTLEEKKGGRRQIIIQKQKWEEDPDPRMRKALALEQLTWRRGEIGAQEGQPPLG